MNDKLIRQLQEADLFNSPEDDFSKLYPGMAFTALAHSSQNYVCAWYYELGTGAFTYTKEPEGHNSSTLCDFTEGKNSERLVRGRVANIDNKNVVVVYSDPEYSIINKMKLNTFALIQIKNRLENVAKIDIFRIVNENGTTLLESKKLDDVISKYNVEVKK